ncbi:hypothetical protein BDF14DRAFT_1698109, partial [Spinellus fusiger]
LSQPSEDQEKKLLIAELGDLKPVAYIDHQGKEHSLLAASKVIDSLISSQKIENQPLFLAITPKKRNHSGEEIETNLSPLIRNVVLDNPYKNLLSKAKQLPQSSLPHIDTRYPNMETCLMNIDTSQKLVLGTKTMNVLITSSIRIDCNEKP